MKARAALALLLALVPAGALALSLPWGAPGQTPAPPPRPVVTEIVTDAPPPAQSWPGVIAASTEVEMAFRTLGRIVERPVDIGDRIEAGAVLARLDPEDLSGNVRAAEAAAAAADVQLRTARSTAERTRSLAGRNVTSTAQLEQAERALAAAEAAAAQAQSQLVRARDALGFAEMKAPFAGIVSAVQTTVGTVVAAGQPVLTLSAETGLEARIDLTQTQLKGIVPGTAFLVRRDTVGATPIAGRVSRIDPVADPRTRTRRVHITLEDGAGFRLGSLIRASRADSPAPRLSVPAAALIAGDAPAVWVVTRDGAAQVTRRAVRLGDTRGGRVTVTSGLAPGEEVVIRGVNSLTEGQAVGRREDP